MKNQTKLERMRIRFTAMPFPLVFTWMVDTDYGSLGMEYYVVTFLFLPIFIYRKQ